MDSETGFLDKVDVVPLEAALLVLESILQLPLGAANDQINSWSLCQGIYSFCRIRREKGLNVSSAAQASQT